MEGQYPLAWRGVLDVLYVLPYVLPYCRSVRGGDASPPPPPRHWHGYIRHLATLRKSRDVSRLHWPDRSTTL